MSNGNDDFSPTIDTELYGMLIRRSRLNLGYRKAEDFVEAMKKRTGFELSKDSLYRIESGKNAPNINFMIALNIMTGKPLTDTSLVNMCIPKEWADKVDEWGGKPYTFAQFDAIRSVNW